MNYIARQHKLITHLKKNSLDALLIKQKHNIMYLTGTRGEDSVLFVSPRKIALVTDARYEEEYKKLSQSFLLCIAKQKNLFGAIAEICQSHRAKRIGFEAAAFSYDDYVYLKNSSTRKNSFRQKTP
jgi:Xaa-Pro aminopeptidase